MLVIGVETTLIKSPNVDVAVEPKPTTVSTPTDSCGLKNTLSSIFRIKYFCFKRNIRN